MISAAVQPLFTPHLPCNPVVADVAAVDYHVFHIRLSISSHFFIYLHNAAGNVFSHVPCGMIHYFVMYLIPVFLFFGA